MTTDQPVQPLDRDAIRARVDAATPGPWESGLEIDGVYAGRRTVVRTAPGQRLLSVGQTRRHDAERAEANVEFVAHARQDVLDLLAEVEQLRAQVVSAHQAGREAAACDIEQFAATRKASADQYPPETAFAHASNRNVLTAYGTAAEVARTGVR